MPGYQEQHQKRMTFKGRSDNPSALLTDPDAYLAFLETQLERVSAACMSVAKYDGRFNDMQALVVQLESRCSSNNKLIEIAQQTTLQMHKELTTSINTTSTRFETHFTKCDARLESAEKRLEESEDAIVDLSVLPAQLLSLEKRTASIETNAKQTDKNHEDYSRVTNDRLGTLEERSYSTEHRLDKLAALLNVHQTETSEAHYAIRNEISAVEARVKDAQAADRESMRLKLIVSDKATAKQTDDLKISMRNVMDAHEKRLSSQAKQADAAYKQLEELLASKDEAQRKATERVRTTIHGELDEITKQIQSTATTSALHSDKLTRVAADVAACHHLATHADKHATRAIEALAKFKPLVTAMASQQQAQNKSQHKLEKAQVRHAERMLTQLEQQEERVMEQLQHAGHTAVAARNELASQLTLLQEAYARAQAATEVERSAHIQHLFDQNADEGNPFHENEHREYERKLEVLIRREDSIRELLEETADNLRLAEEKSLNISRSIAPVPASIPEVAAAAAAGAAATATTAATTRVNPSHSATEIIAEHEQAAEEEKVDRNDAAPATAAPSTAFLGADVEPSAAIKSLVQADQLAVDSSSSNSSGEVGKALHRFLDDYDDMMQRPDATSSNSNQQEQHLYPEGNTARGGSHGRLRPRRSAGHPGEVDKFQPARSSNYKQTRTRIRGLQRRTQSNSPTRDSNRSCSSPKRMDLPFFPTHGSALSREEQQAADARRSNAYAEQRLQQLNESFGQSLLLPTGASGAGGALLNMSLSGISDGLYIHDPLAGDIVHRTRFLSPHFSRVRTPTGVWRYNKTALYPRDTSPERLKTKVSAAQTAAGEVAGSLVYTIRPRHSSPKNYGLRSATSVHNVSATDTRSAINDASLNAEMSSELSESYQLSRSGTSSGIHLPLPPAPWSPQSQAQMQFFKDAAKTTQVGSNRGRSSKSVFTEFSPTQSEPLPPHKRKVLHL